MRKKIFKIILYIAIILTVILFCFYGYAYYMMNYKTDPENRNNHSLEKTNPETALLSNNFEVANKYFNMCHYNKRANFDTLRKISLKTHNN